MKTKPTILVVGSGNVAWHLCNSFNLSKYKIRGIAARSLEKLENFIEKFVKKVNDFPEVVECHRVSLNTCCFRNIFKFSKIKSSGDWM